MLLMFRRTAVREVPQDPLKFRDSKRYSDRLKAMKAETDLDDAVPVGEGKLEGLEVVAAVQDFRFMGGHSAWPRVRPWWQA
jgi:acetyl-CoA carboxylase carboxyl transferase subunit beta